LIRKSCGKLLVCGSSFSSGGKRLKSVSAAAERMAKKLNLDLEVVTFREKIAPIYVYFRNGDEEPIPIYCDKSEKSNIQEVCMVLRNMMFVLSFHPKHLALKKMRKEIMRFS
jgi:hypothetical protein